MTDLEEIFESVEPAGRVYHPLSMPHNHHEIYLCRGLTVPIEELWPQVKNYS